MKQTIEEFIKRYGRIELLDGNTYRGSLDLGGTGITSLPNGLVVGGDLDLSGTAITSLPDGLTVAGDLNLEGCTGITSLPDGLTVAGDLNLEGCTGITSLPDGLTVAGDLYLRGTGITNTDHVKRTVPPALFWQGGKYVKADGIFSRVVSHHGNVYRIAKIGRKEEQYLVTDGNGKWAHGDTLAKAREDLKFKISNRDTSKYKGLPLDHEFSEDEAIECYRVVSGACAAGTKHFLLEVLPEEKRQERYTIAQMIELTKGQYGAETFRTFFKG